MESAKNNTHNRRHGQNHPRAVLLDHDVDLILQLLADRKKLIAQLGDVPRGDVDRALSLAGLSYRCIAIKFEVNKSCIAKIAHGQRRGWL